MADAKVCPICGKKVSAFLSAETIGPKSIWTLRGGENSVKKMLFLIALASCILMGGCLGSHQYRNNSSNRLNEAEYKKMDEYFDKLYDEQYNKKEKSEYQYSYPTKVENINTVFNTLEKYKKDEFTSTEQYIENTKYVIDKIMGGKEYIIFKAVSKKDVDGSYLPTLSYNADKKEAHIVLSSSYFDYWEGKNNLSNKQMYSVIENIRKRSETGANIFGVTNTYEMQRGNRIGLYFENILFIKNMDMPPDVARSLKGNLEVFFVVTLNTDSNVTKTIRYRDISLPTIDTAVAWDINDKILVTHLKAILICNKKTKEVVRTLYF